MGILLSQQCINYIDSNNTLTLFFIDEVDAFPLSMDPNLLLAIDTASKTIHSHIYMTATPPRQLIKQMSSNKIIKLPARFHRQPLPVPRFKYFKLNTTRVQPQFIHLYKRKLNNNGILWYF